MTTENIDIRIREDGSRAVKRNLEELDPAARKAASGVDFLKKVLAGLGGALAIREVVQLLDTFTTLQNRLRSTGLEAENLTGVYQALLKVSNDTRSSVEGSVELYARLAVSSKELGVSQQDLIGFTKSLNQAIILSGASAQEAQAGIIQLSQGIASGTLRGDELRSVLEQLPAVADVIAKSMGKTRGELRKLGEEGKITAQEVLKAFANARQELDERFAKTVPTISQSFQVLRNRVVDLVGQYDKATGASTALSKAILFISENLDGIARAILAVVGGLALVVGAAAGVRALAGAVQALTLAIAANPVGAIAVALTTAILAVTLFRDKILLGTDAVTTLGDYLRAFGEAVAPAFRALLDAAESAFGPLFRLIREWLAQTDFSIIGIIKASARGVDTFIGLWRGAVAALVAIFEGVPPALSDLFTQALNVVLDKLSRFVNKAGELLSTVTEFAGLGKIATNLDFTLDNKDAGAAKRLGGDIAAAFKEGFDRSNPAQAFVSRLENRAVELGQNRKLEERFAGGVVNDQRTKAVKPPVDAKELEKAQNALRSLLNTIQPSSGAVLELAKAQKTLNEAQKFGLITGEQNAKYLALARRYYQDIIDPLGKINRELDEQTQLLQVNTGEREVESQLLQITKDLQRQGIDITQQETDGLRAKLKALQDLNLVTQAQDAIYEQSIGKRKEFEAQLVALQNMLQNPQFTSGDAAGATNSLLQNLGLDTEGTQVALDAQVAAFQRMYDQIAALRQKNLIDEQTAVQLQQRVAVQQQEARLKNTQDFFGNLASLANSGNKRIAAIGRAAAITQATIDGVLAVQKALTIAPPPVNYALAAAVGAAAAANVARIAGFREGGYTGDGGLNQVAGVVHGREFVMNADATRKNRATLEAMNSGATIGGEGGKSNVYVTVNNMADGTRATTQERDTPDGREVEVTIERVVTKQIRSGGPIAAAAEAQWGLNRASGTTR